MADFQEPLSPLFSLSAGLQTLMMVLGRLLKVDACLLCPWERDHLLSDSLVYFASVSVCDRKPKQKPLKP